MVRCTAGDSRVRPGPTRFANPQSMRAEHGELSGDAEVRFGEFGDRRLREVNDAGMAA